MTLNGNKMLWISTCISFHTIEKMSSKVYTGLRDSQAIQIFVQLLTKCTIKKHLALKG